MEFIKKEVTISITFSIKGELYERVEEKITPGDNVKVTWFGNSDETDEHKKMRIRFMTDLASFDDKEEMYQQKHKDLKIIEEDIDTELKVRHNGLTYRRFEYFNITRDILRIYWDGNGCDENGFEQCKLGEHKGTKYEDFVNDLETNYQSMSYGK